jgi:hypothetical protein
VKHLTTILSLVLLAALVGGCTEYVVRDAAVYQTELNQYDSWATKQAALLKGFMASSCTCDAGQKFTSTECADAADFVLTIEARHEWHKAMSLFLAGLTEDRPPKAPPEIPASSTLCPTTTPSEGSE